MKHEATWAHGLEPLSDGSTGLIVRAGGGSSYQFHGLPWSVTKRIVPLVPFTMRRKTTARHRAAGRGAELEPASINAK